MKLMKTKLGLSVLALALVGAGAWSLQSPVATSAEVDTSGFKMENGASVCLAGTDSEGNEFHGIRWTTTVTSDFYASASATKSSQFGVIIAPTSLFTGDLTFDTTLSNGSSIKRLPITNIDASSEDVKYYSVIDYSELGTDASEAYKLELTARAYVDVDGDLTTTGDCYYADMKGINTSRSARQVAVSAELAGSVESENMDRAKEYYGADENVTANADFVKNVGAKGTQYIDMENDTTVDVAITVDGTIEEVLIGSKSVGYTYEGTTLKINDLSGIVCGEQYVTVFTDNGIVTQPIIGATKVLDGVEDLTMFNAKGGYGEYSVQRGGEDLTYVKTYWKAEQEQGGYYVLANDIEAEGYKHGSVYADDTKESGLDLTAGYYNTSTWDDAETYEGLPIGLTGTFNGMGYAIKDMEIANEREGFFGIVNGGTVKNVAFTDVKSALTEYAYVVANYLLNATLENVYVKTDEYVADANDDGVAESIGFPMKSSAGLAEYYQGHTTMKSCVVEFSLSSQSGGNGSYSATNIRGAGTGILFSGYKDDYGVDDATEDAKVVLTCEDVYCLSANKLGAYSQYLINWRGTKDDNGSWQGNGVLMGDGYGDAETNTTTSDNNISTREDGVTSKVHGDPRHFVIGAYRYNTLVQLGSAGHTFASLSASGCWSIVENLPVWGAQ